nr:GNAT family N-acetyltransferase [Planosporangium flavigriseum]
MECAKGEAGAQAVPAGIELIAPTTDAELLDLLTAQHEAYDEPEAPTGANVAAARQALEAGGLAVLARDTDTGEPAGGGICTPIFDGVGEIAGVGVRPTFRRRGIAGAITAYLTREAHRSGADLTFLMPAGEDEQRIYGRVGFHATDEVVFFRLVFSRAATEDQSLP